MSSPFAPYCLGAALVLLLFLRRFRGDRRRFGNGVLLGLGTVLLLAGAIVELDRFPRPLARAATAGILVGAVLTALVTAGFLLANGIRVARREGGGRPATLLTGAAGLAILGLLGLLTAAARFENGVLRAIAGGALLVAGYLSFLCACFVGYALLYQRLPARRRVDFVVVLGAGLVDGSTVPPLLASRLDRALSLYRRQAADGRAPVLLASGGKGSDEQVPEAEAMAEYLAARGVPRDHLLQERDSVNTTENLRFSGELMERLRPGYRCVIVTNDFHALRAAITARRAGVRGEAAGSPTAAYYWPSATLREFVAVLTAYPVTNLVACALLAAAGARAGGQG
ncbi:YdcF family protein [Kitasatospora sp. NPDC006697]|uniref:YdcF family protein n=1 Tax=Kitasatospora sp. NPDC006697 TaxID=3364020 RepID=UPI0036C88E0C